MISVVVKKDIVKQDLSVVGMLISMLIIVLNVLESMLVFVTDFEKLVFIFIKR